MILTLPGFTMAALGDLEPPAQALVGPVPLVDVVKVAHHGSRYQDPDLYRRLAPRLALVSVGAGNDYGHPAPATMRLLQDDGARVARTDQFGDVAVGVDGSGNLWMRGR